MAQGRWRRVLFAVALMIAILEVLDAFLLEVPFTAIAMAVLLVVGALWLRGQGRGPVVLIGVVCLIQLLLILVFFGLVEQEPPPSVVEVGVGTLLGVACALGLLLVVLSLRSPSVNTISTTPTM